jgi:hypothetical protein
MFNISLKSIFFSTIILFSTAACNNAEAQKKEEAAALKLVLDVHDEVMPKMTFLAKAETALEEDIKNPALKVKLPELEAKLKQNIAAQDAMMDWMANFKEDFKGMNHTEIMTYLAAEKVKVDAMKATIMSELK